MNNKYIYWIGIIIVLALVAWGLSALAPGQQPEEPQPGNTTSLGMRAEANAVFAFDQKEGETLIITGASFNPEGTGGFVVLHAQENGAPGAIIGVSEHLSAGENQDITVTLSQSVANGDTVYAMLHGDDGDQTFDAQKDAPIQSTIAEGPIMGSFIIDENAELPAAVMY